MSYWTIKRAGDALEQSVADWGIEHGSMQRQKRSAAIGTLSFVTVPTAFDADPVLDEGDVVTVYRGREFTGETWTGGTRWFHGTVRRIVRDRQANGFHFHKFLVQDTWYQFEQANYLQKVYFWDGTLDEDGHAVASYTQDFTRMVLLPFDRIAGMITTEAQVQSIIDYCRTDVIPPIDLTVGTISLAPGGFSGGTVPLREYQGPKVIETLTYMLHWNPDAVAWIDDSTEPSTFHAVKWSALESVTIPLGTGAYIPEAVTIEPLTDLQADGVVFQFRKTNEVDGESSLYITQQSWPGTLTGRELGVVCDTFDLQGFKQTILRSEVEVADLNANHATTALKVAWWQANDRLLSDPLVSDVAISDVKFFVDGVELSEVEAAALVAAKPRYLLDGEITDWMEADGVTFQEVEIRGQAQFKKWTTAEQTTIDEDLIASGKFRTVNVTGIIATNALTQTYSTVELVQDQESEPAGLARWFYESTSVLHYAGQIVITEAEIADRISVGQRLNLSGGRAEWETMNAMVTAVDNDVGAGTTTVTFGPPRFLGVRDLIEYLRINRVQGRRLTGASTVQTGKLPAGNKITQSGARARRNTTSSSPGGGGSSSWNWP